MNKPGGGWREGGSYGILGAGGAWSVKRETWGWRRAVLVRVCALSIAVVTVIGCGFMSPVPATLSPAPTATNMPSPSSTPTATPPPLPSATPTATCTPVPSPTPTPVPTPDCRLVRGPYLQSVTPYTIVVAWETDRPSRGEVAYSETLALDRRVAGPGVGTRHAVTLTRLSPYTVYHYRIESGGAPLGPEATFHTAAGPDQAQFTFAVLGDTRTQHAIHQAVVARIVAQGPDFVLHTGDLVARGHSAGDWATFFEIERELMARAPLFPTPGNHEGNSPLYFDLFHLPGNERWYAFDYGPARFVCLQVDGIADFRPGSEQYAWLRDTLATNTQPWLFVAFHVPPYSSARNGLENEVRQALVPLFERYGVDMVFNSHRHNYERNEVNGITYVVTGGGGAPLYAMQEREPTQAAFAMAYHFVLVEVDGHRLRGQAISVEGEVLDEFERGDELSPLSHGPSCGRIYRR